MRGFYIQSRVCGWVWAGALYISESRSTEPARGQPTYTQAYRWKAGREGSVSGRQCDQRWFSAGQRQWLRTIACSSVQTPAGKVKVLSQVFWSATPRIVPSTCKCLKDLQSRILEIVNSESESRGVNRSFQVAMVKSQNCTGVGMVGGKFMPPTLRGSVKFRDFVEQYLCSL